MKKTFLDNKDFGGLVDFQQFFVGDLTKNVSKCIHGEEECVGQRHFACAQGEVPPPPYSNKNSRWLDFEACSYGKCTDCAAIEGEHCPCYNYTIFPIFEKNTVMQDCATELGLDWESLHECATNGTGQHLMEMSSTKSNNDGVTYGVDGLAPIYLDGEKIHTSMPIPIVCGPVPSEIKKAVCAKLKLKGAVPKACT